MSVLEAERICVADLDAKILALERSLSGVRTQRTLVQDRIKAYKYPVLTLPNEIVSQIFIHFPPIYPNCPPTAGILSPFTLTHICHKWREIALATPDLWRAVALPLHSEISFARQARETDDWLSRSRSCPLSIEIVDNDCMLDGWELEIFAALSSHRARWEHLKLSLTETRLQVPFEAPMPLLRHLNLFVNNSDNHSDPIVFGEAPLLRSVILIGYAARNVVLPWAQLTMLALYQIFAEECVPILQQTLNLIHCQLALIKHGDTVCPNVTLPRLEVLHIRDFHKYAHPPSGCLQSFITPALRELHVPEKYLDHPIDSLKEFISKSGCKLREVHIGNPTTAATEEIYRSAFPSIPKFFFNGGT